MDLADLPARELNGWVKHCKNINELHAQLVKYKTHICVVACTTTKMTELTSILNASSIDTLYILNLGDETKYSVGPLYNKITVVYTEKQLMRHLSTKAMLCFYKEGLDYRENGDFGLANLCFLDALHALDCSAKFI